MADTSDSTGVLNETTPTETGSIMISEADDTALRDVMHGLHAIASLCEDRSGPMANLLPCEWAGLMRVMSQHVGTVISHGRFVQPEIPESGFTAFP